VCVCVCARVVVVVEFGGGGGGCGGTRCPNGEKHPFVLLKNRTPVFDSS